MAKIDLAGMAKIDIGELLTTHPREDVAELMVRLGIAYDLPNAEFYIAISLGESEGDWIRLERIPRKVRELLGRGYSEDEVARVLVHYWGQTEPEARRHLDIVLGRHQNPDKAD